MLLEFLKTAFVTLLVTLDPPGLAPVFIGLTLGMTRAAQREVALRATVIAFAILAAFAFGGGAVMDLLGISIPAFRIAGGLLLFYIAFDMIFELRASSKHTLASDAVTIDRIRNVAAFPLAIPLLSGPGSITATMLLAGRAGGDWLLSGCPRRIPAEKFAARRALSFLFARQGRFSHPPAAAPVAEGIGGEGGA